MEKRVLIPNSNSRPADLLLCNWTSGKDTSLDITIINALRSVLVSLAAEHPGHALSVAYGNKWRLYGELCEAEGMSFIPLPFDTLGAPHEVTVQQLTKLAKALSRANGSEEADSIRHLFQRVSMLLTRSNASLILNRKPVLLDPSIDGNY